MSIAGALSNALSGLTASARAAQVVSDNIANAMTPGYAARDVELGVRVVGNAGAGVSVLGVTRRTDPALTGERRLADAGAGASSVAADFTGRMHALVGNPDDPASISGRLATFGARLDEVASRPDSTTRLQNVLGAATALVESINAAGTGVQAARLAADGAIAADVADLRAGLDRVRALNVQLQGAGGDTSALRDLRQREIDRISDIVPLRVLDRDRGTVALMTTGGQMLLDGSAAEIGFTAVNAVAAGQTLAGGGLSGLTVNGRAVALNAGGRMDGGTLAAHFDQRDRVGVAAQDRLDTYAADLVARFADPAVDATLAGGAGLFTDGGSLPTTPPLVGLAGRLELNAAVDPVAGGAPWRLRDGLGAATPGPVGDASLLLALGDALTARRTVSGADFGPASQDAAGLAGALSALTAGARSRADEADTFLQSRRQALTRAEAEQGVDTDQEMQKLLLIEQSYAANARVIQTVDGLIQRLLEI